jgi:hypothetical protein
MGACVALLQSNADQTINQLPNQQLPELRFPTQNHNRNVLSKGNANY